MNFFTVKTLAERWQISAMSVYRLAKRGELKATKIGSQIRFNIDDVRAYEERREDEVAA